MEWKTQKLNTSVGDKNMQTKIMGLEPNISDVTEVDTLEDTFISVPVNYEDSHACDTHLNHLS